MREVCRYILMTVFLFVGLLFVLGVNGTLTTASSQMKTVLAEEKEFLLETETIAAPALLCLGQPTDYAMLRSIVDIMQLKQGETTYLRSSSIIVVCVLSILLLIGFRSGLFAYLISGNREPDDIISLIQIIHQTDGKKRNAYS